MDTLRIASELIPTHSPDQSGNQTAPATAVSRPSSPLHLLSPEDFVTEISSVDVLLENPPVLQADPLAEPVHCIARALHQTGYSILPAALPRDLLDALYLRCKTLDDDDFHPAGTGRQSDYSIKPTVRKDTICWIDRRFPETSAYLDWIETLRLNLNRDLFLGLFDYESHYAYYEPGAFYKKHLDAFKGNTNRVVSTVLYLNPHWQPGDGGELYLYDPEDADRRLEIVTPEYGKLVVFLSEQFPHEVLPVNRPRCSIAGWFRVNTNLGVTLDPPR